MDNKAIAERDRRRDATVQGGATLADRGRAVDQSLAVGAAAAMSEYQSRQRLL